MKSLFTKIKKIATITVLTFCISFSSLFAQAPEKMTYQAVIRNSSDQLVTNSPIGMKISILQTSVSGTTVYVETQTQSTNENGIVTLEIGGGNVVSGIFANIDWASGLYFIKTETDISGGTNYTITATSQLLSVPYALYAKTAGTATTTSGHYVGELFGGGIVFWVDHTGEHGLIVSMVDLSTIQSWSNIIDTSIGTINDWDGVTNSSAIISQSGHTSSAAQLCLDYTNDDYGTNTYSDWYLPSVTELYHLLNNLYEVQKAITNDENSSTTVLAKTSYWSSSESDETEAYCIYFDFSSTDNSNKSYLKFVRAIRKF